MEITLDGSRFDYRTCYQEENGLRGSFCALAQEVFGVDFEPWHRAGYWGDRYRLYSLVQEGKVAANVSASPMDLRCMGKEFHFLQIGTVMSAPSERGRGLIHFLMARVLTDWKGKCDGIYLFANGETVDFYPRFGFARVREFRHTMSIQPQAGGRTPRRMIPELSQDKALLLRRYQKGNPYSLLQWEHNPGLLMFHCGGDLRECIYDLPDFDLTAVVTYDGNTMYCQELLGSGSGAELETVLTALAQPETEKAVLGFTPRAGGRCSVRPLSGGEGVLLAQGQVEPLLRHYQMRFPILSHT